MGNLTTHTQTRKLRFTEIRYQWKKECYWSNMSSVCSISTISFDFICRKTQSLWIWWRQNGLQCHCMILLT